MDRVASQGAAPPHPDLAPLEVIERVLTALKHNDLPHPDAGVETLYAFAAPRLRAQVGDLDTFKRLLNNDLYAPLLNHGRVRLEPLERRGDAARQLVLVEPRETAAGNPGGAAAGVGVATPYLFSLVEARLDASHSGAPHWLLSGLARADLLGKT